MIKAIALLKAKAGLTRDQFIDYYETQHAPMNRRLFPQIVEYRRNFIDLTGAFIFEGASAPDFDVITELWYADRASYEEMLARAAQPEIAAQIVADEDAFLDRSKTRYFLVDERCTQGSLTAP